MSLNALTGFSKLALGNTDLLHSPSEAIMQSVVQDDWPQLSLSGLLKPNKAVLQLRGQLSSNC